MKVGQTLQYDIGSPASQKIRELVRTNEAELDSDIHRVQLTRSGEITSRVEGAKISLGRLDGKDGWPFGESSFEELKHLSEEER